MINDIDRFSDAEPFLHPGDKFYWAMMQSFCFLVMFYFAFNTL